MDLKFYVELLEKVNEMPFSCLDDKKRFVYIIRRIIRKMTQVKEWGPWRRIKKRKNPGDRSLPGSMNLNLIFRRCVMSMSTHVFSVYESNRSKTPLPDAITIEGIYQAFVSENEKIKQMRKHMRLWLVMGDEATAQFDILTALKDGDSWTHVQVFLFHSRMRNFLRLVLY